MHRPKTEEDEGEREEIFHIHSLIKLKRKKRKQFFKENIN